MPNRGSAELLAEMIAQASRSVSEGVQKGVEGKMRLYQIRLEEARNRLAELRTMSPEQRKKLLAEPSYVTQLAYSLGPLNKKTGGDELQRRIKLLQTLGEPTAEETAKLGQEQAKTRQEQSKADIEQYKADVVSGKVAASPMSLLKAGMITDPIAAALFSTIPQDALSNIAQAEKKTGPLYQQQQQQEWFKWAMGEGIPVGPAMQYGLAISKGEWDKVPQFYAGADGKQIPIRGKAEQQLGIDMLNALSRQKEVQNNMENSIAQSTAELAQKSGLTLDQARQDVMWMRAGGKGKAPYATPHLTNMVEFDETIKRQEIEKNTQAILSDKAGLGMINESLKTMVDLYKQQGIVGGALSGAQERDLEDKIGKLTEALASGLAGRYGLKFDTYEQMHPWRSAVSGAVGKAIDSGKSTGAFGLDIIKDATGASTDKAKVDMLILEDLTKRFKAQLPSASKMFSDAGFSELGAASPAKVKREHTPEEQKVLQQISDGIGQALGNPQVPDDQKQKLRDYFQGKVLPAYEDPDKFLDLFTSPAGATQ